MRCKSDANQHNSSAMTFSQFRMVLNMLFLLPQIMYMAPTSLHNIYSTFLNRQLSDAYAFNFAICEIQEMHSKVKLKLACKCFGTEYFIVITFQN